MPSQLVPRRFLCRTGPPSQRVRPVGQDARQLVAAPMFRVEAWLSICPTDREQFGGLHLISAICLRGRTFGCDLSASRYLGGAHSNHIRVDGYAARSPLVLHGARRPMRHCQPVLPARFDCHSQEVLEEKRSVEGNGCDHHVFVG